jgi:hypothetical protein
VVRAREQLTAADSGDSRAGAGEPRARQGLESRRARLVLALLFLALLGAFAAGIWGTIVRPAPFEVRGTVVARAAPDLLLVRHEELPALAMQAMELMAVTAEPAQLDAFDPRPGERVRLAVRPRGDALTLVRIERLR